jgi:hypothetical protein
MGDDRFLVELKDTLLFDALKMVFRAAGNPSHIIDDTAKSVSVAPVVFNNVAWDSVVRQMANQNGFKMTRNAQGTFIIEPRVVATEPGFPGGFNPGGFNPGGFNPGGGDGQNRGWAGRRRGMGGQGAVPGNPFGGEAISPMTRVNPQTTPMFGGAAGGAATTDAGAVKEFRIVPVNHVYVGGIASLFSGNVGVVTTLQFVTTASGQQGVGQTNQGGQQGGQQGGGFGGGGDQGGGFGGGGGTSGGGTGGITF